MSESCRPMPLQDPYSLVTTPIQHITGSFPFVCCWIRNLRSAGRYVRFSLHELSWIEEGAVISLLLAIISGFDRILILLSVLLCGRFLMGYGCPRNEYHFKIILGVGAALSKIVLQEEVNLYEKC